MFRSPVRIWRGIAAGIAAGFFAAGTATAAKGERIVVGYAAAPPVAVAGDEQGEHRPRGIALELIDQVARESGWKAVYKAFPVDQLWDRLESGDIDVAAGVVHSYARAQRFDFNRRRLIADWSAVYRSESIPMRTIFDLEGRRIAMSRSDDYAEALIDLLQLYGIEYIEVETESQEASLRAIDDGLADAAVLSQLAGLAASHRHKAIPTPLFLAQLELRYAFRKGQHEKLSAALDQAIEQASIDPGAPLNTIVNAWMRQPGSRFSMPAWAWWGMSALAAAMLAGLGFTLALRHQVELKTREVNAARLATEEAYAARTRFLAIISHELKTPLTAILGFSQTMAVQDLPPAARTTARRIADNGARLHALIDDLLMLAASDVDGQIVRESFDFEAFWTDLERDARELDATRAGVDLVFSAERGGVSPAMRGDVRKLRRILKVLIDNALKYTEKGRVSVHASLEGRDASTVRATFDVHDEGRGMDRETLDRAFQPFSRGDESLSRATGGAGLGLSVAKRLVEALGGDIVLTSDIGAGTRVRVTVPIERGEGRG